MSISNVYNINIDIKKTMSSVLPSFRKGDTGQLIFKLYDNGIEIDLSGYGKAELYHRLPSGATLVSNCLIDRGTILFDYTTLDTIEFGYIETMLVVYTTDRSHIISSRPFSVFIYGLVEANDGGGDGGSGDGGSGSISIDNRGIVHFIGFDLSKDANGMVHLSNSSI